MDFNPPSFRPNLVLSREPSDHAVQQALKHVNLPLLNNNRPAQSFKIMLKPELSIVKCFEVLLLLFNYDFRREWKHMSTHITPKLFNQIKDFSTREVGPDRLVNIRSILNTIKTSTKSKPSVASLYTLTSELVIYYEQKLLTDQLPSQTNLINNDLAEKMMLISPINRDNQSPEPMDSLLLPLKKESNMDLVCGIEEEKQVRFENEPEPVQLDNKLKRNVRSKSFGENILKTPIKSQRQSLHQNQIEDKRTIKTQESERQDDNLKEELKLHKILLDKLLNQELQIKKQIAYQVTAYKVTIYQKQVIKDLEQQRQQKIKKKASPQSAKNKKYLEKRIQTFLQK